MEFVTNKGKADGKSRGVLLSLILRIFKTIEAFNDFDNSSCENVNGVVLNVEVVTTEFGPDNPMHDIPINFDPKYVGENGNENVCKEASEYVNDNVNKYLNKDEFVSVDVHNDDNEVSNDDINDEVIVVRKSTQEKQIRCIKKKSHCLI
ncbi:hypothetical protein RYX36_027318 [Vicia faba]